MADRNELLNSLEARRFREEYFEQNRHVKPGTTLNAG